jgi:hypothetical protein
MQSLEGDEIANRASEADVGRLAAHHAARPRRRREPTDDRCASFRRHFGRSEQRERLGEQSITHEDRRGFPERLVDGGSSPADVVVVHGREIVVNQRVGVDELEGHRDRQHVVDVDPGRHRLGRREHERGPNTLAAGQQGISEHRREFRRPHVAEGRAQSLLEPGSARREPGFEAHPGEHNTGW